MKMWTPLPLPLLILAILFSYQSAAAASYISRGAIEQGDGLISKQSRHLLQIETSCSINFQVQNYTVITSECKGPYYPRNACCAAFVKFACPFAAEINDNTTDCATNMFNYINVYGNYPPGLFANECTGDALGLPCPPSPTASPSASSAVRTPVDFRNLWWVLLIGFPFMEDLFRGNVWST